MMNEVSDKNTTDIVFTGEDEESNAACQASKENAKWTNNQIIDLNDKTDDSHGSSLVDTVYEDTDINMNEDNENSRDLNDKTGDSHISSVTDTVEGDTDINMNEDNEESGDLNDKTDDSQISSVIDTVDGDRDMSMNENNEESEDLNDKTDDIHISSVIDRVDEVWDVSINEDNEESGDLNDKTNDSHISSVINTVDEDTDINMNEDNEESGDLNDKTNDSHISSVIDTVDEDTDINMNEDNEESGELNDKTEDSHISSVSDTVDEDTDINRNENNEESGDLNDKTGDNHISSVTNTVDEDIDLNMNEDNGDDPINTKRLKMDQEQLNVGLKINTKARKTYKRKGSKLTVKKNSKKRKTEAIFSENIKIESPPKITSKVESDSNSINVIQEFNNEDIHCSTTENLQDTNVCKKGTTGTKSRIVYRKKKTKSKGKGRKSKVSQNTRKGYYKKNNSTVGSEVTRAIEKHNGYTELKLVGCDSVTDVKEMADSNNKGTPKKKLGRPPIRGEFKCSKCNYITDEKRNLAIHRQKCRPPLKCHYCDYTTRTMQSYMEHEAKHTKERPFKCDKCSYASRYKADLYHHRAKHQTEKVHKCPHCDFITKWKRNIHHHLLRHTEERPYSCDLCGFSFKRIQDLKYHLYRHNEKKPIPCDQCDFRCKTNYELKCHKLKHSDERKFACSHPGCTQRVKTKSDLTKHMKTHLKVKPHTCDKCGKGFKTMSCLNKHKQRHTDQRPFSCDICQRKFKVRTSLKNHIKLHTGIKPFICDICGHRFSSRSNMNVHVKTHEVEDRPFRCPICPHGSKTKAHLLAHIGSMHGNAFAYFCELCKKPFKRYHQLEVHYKRMHTLKELESLNFLSDLKVEFKQEPEEEDIKDEPDETDFNDEFEIKENIQNEVDEVELNRLLSDENSITMYNNTEHNVADNSESTDQSFNQVGQTGKLGGKCEHRDDVENKTMHNGESELEDCVNEPLGVNKDHEEENCSDIGAKNKTLENSITITKELIVSNEEVLESVGGNLQTGNEKLLNDTATEKVSRTKDNITSREDGKDINLSPNKECRLINDTGVKNIEQPDNGTGHKDEEDLINEGKSEPKAAWESLDENKSGNIDGSETGSIHKAPYGQKGKCVSGNIDKTRSENMDETDSGLKKQNESKNVGESDETQKRVNSGLAEKSDSRNIDTCDKTSKTDNSEVCLSTNDDMLRNDDEGKHTSRSETRNDEQESHIKPDTYQPYSSVFQHAPATLAMYDGFRLPLATKGFEFNLDKTGKKPRSWFMDPENIYNKDFRDHQMKYLDKQQRLYKDVKPKVDQTPRKRGRPVKTKCFPSSSASINIKTETYSPQQIQKKNSFCLKPCSVSLKKIDLTKPGKQKSLKVVKSSTDVVESGYELESDEMSSDVSNLLTKFPGKKSVDRRNLFESFSNIMSSKTEQTHKRSLGKNEQGILSGQFSRTQTEAVVEMTHDSIITPSESNVIVSTDSYVRKRVFKTSKKKKSVPVPKNKKPKKTKEKKRKISNEIKMKPKPKKKKSGSKKLNVKLGFKSVDVHTTADDGVVKNEGMQLPSTCRKNGKKTSTKTVKKLAKDKRTKTNSKVKYNSTEASIKQKKRKYKKRQSKISSGNIALQASTCDEWNELDQTNIKTEVIEMEDNKIGTKEGLTDFGQNVSLDCDEEPKKIQFVVVEPRRDISDAKTLQLTVNKRSGFVQTKFLATKQKPVYKPRFKGYMVKGKYYTFDHSRGSKKNYKKDYSNLLEQITEQDCHNAIKDASDRNDKSATKSSSAVKSKTAVAPKFQKLTPLAKWNEDNPDKRIIPDKTKTKFVKKKKKEEFVIEWNTHEEIEDHSGADVETQVDIEEQSSNVTVDNGSEIYNKQQETTVIDIHINSDTVVKQEIETDEPINEHVSNELYGISAGNSTPSLSTNSVNDGEVKFCDDIAAMQAPCSVMEVVNARHLAYISAVQNLAFDSNQIESSMPNINSINHLGLRIDAGSGLSQEINNHTVTCCIGDENFPESTSLQQSSIYVQQSDRISNQPAQSSCDSLFNIQEQVFEKDTENTTNVVECKDEPPMDVEYLKSLYTNELA